MYFNIFDSRGSLPHFISSQPKAPRPPCSCFSFGRGKSIRQVGFQVKQPSTALIQQIKRHQATSSDVKRRQATQPGRSDRSDRSDITQEVFLWFAFGLVACSDVLKCWMQCRCRHGCEILFVLQFVSALFYFLHESQKSMTAHLSYFIIMYSLHGVSYTDLSSPYPFEAARIFQDAVGCDRAFFFASAALTKDRISSSA